MPNSQIPTVVLADSVNDKMRSIRLVNPPHSSVWATLGGWTARIITAVLLCFNFYILNYITCIAVFGWFYRWMQGLTLRGWWKQSRFHQMGTFRDFCDTLDKHKATSRPRWFLHEEFSKRMSAPMRDGTKPGPFRMLGRILYLPVHSLLVNFAIGLQGLTATYLVLGLPCLIMLFSWYLGWTNSFYKVYEQAFLGAAIGVAGSILFALALFYVPLAQAHQAAAGQFRAFFHFRTVWCLMTTRMTAFASLALLYFLFSLILEPFRLIVFRDDFFANDLTLTASQRFVYFRYYLLGYTAVLIGTLFFLKWVTVVIYRSAVLKALRMGWIMPEDLPDNLRNWLEKLDIMPIPLARNTGVVQAGRAAVRWSYRKLLYLAVFVIWAMFVFRFYAGYFIVSTDFLGFLNHPVIQLPCVDYTPSHLHDAAYR